MLALPDDLKHQLKSKPKLTKLTFLDKLNLLVEWAGDDEMKKNYIGLKKSDDGFLVNIDVLSQHFEILRRSLMKNFLLIDYQKRSYQSSKEWVIFSPKKNTNSIMTTFTNLQQELTKNDFGEWNSAMLYNWDLFTVKFPERKVGDFTRQFIKNNSVLSISSLIKYFIRSDFLDAKNYQILFQHFSPISSIPGKISAFFASILARGWSIGEGKRTVKIIQPNKFLFNDGMKQIILENDMNCQFPGLWLISNSENGRRYEIESFFERKFPKEIPSNELFIESIMEHFPKINEVDSDE
ncbi:hypothetical protein TRFO_26076 [Tritrichomonas foetus]|uniref:Initiator binding domain-containing protein n=1 Tax=Tritrichomonas foetus TaxID=1144522 RepID=A0A1J4K485_9EUKA|nr:hypothetical protein TRFO_26076 [Tritrichomonas foetus]|eukprot:OHT06003.1 hypothetical protein TRFO_26076 [Tritrichomonas foetus]